MIRPIKLYNTRTRSVDLLEPLEEGQVGIYSCGPTVYNYAHIGNLRAYIFVDTLKRALQWCGYQTNHIMNITDVGHLTDDASDGEDKMELAAKKSGRDIWDLSRYYTSVFFEHTGDLGIQPPNTVCRATDHIKEQIDMVQTIMDNGFAYQVDDGIYLDTGKLPKYADFARLSLEGQQAGARVDVVQGKKSPTDFAIWKFAKGAKRQMEWESPWGRGRPGWHIECSAMISELIGSEFDIHGGGIDLIFPHHENEIAQSCSNNSSEKFANYWVHNGFVTMNKEKMSKSLGNIISIEDSVKKFSGQVVRLALLSSHYKQPLDWNDKLLQDQSVILNKWYSIFDDEHYDKLPDCFEHLLDDLNTPAFISKMHELFNLASKGNKDKKREFNKACRLIGLFNENLRVREALKKEKVKISEKFILMKIEERIEARKSGNFKLADKIRDELLLEGVIIEDDKEKTIWKYK